jgi:ABC-2 type transport system permease protein
VRDALRFEWVRLRTLRSTYWLVGSALVIGGAVAFLLALATRRDPRSAEIVVAVLTGGGANSPLPFTAFFLGVVGVLATGHEYRYGTIQPTLTAVPQRTRLLAAKVVVVAAAALVVGALSLLTNLGAGLIFWGDVPELTAAPLAGQIGLVVLWAVLGVALGQLFRGVPVPLVAILVVPLVVEQLIFRLSFVPALDWLQPAVKFLPFTAGQRLVSVATEAGLTDAAEIDLFGRWAAGGVFAVFAGLVLVAAGVLFRRRDA